MKCALLLVLLLAGLVVVATGQNGLNTTKPAPMPDADFQRCREELQLARDSALTHFRLGESFFEDRNFQAAANEFRDALNGGPHPHPNWIDAWVHIDLGEILDATGQRDRAIVEYKQAIATGDNTDGAQEIARKGMTLEADFPRLHRVSLDAEISDGIVVDIAAEYPLEARIAGLEGAVYLAGTVTADRSVRGLRVVQALGLGLEEAAIRAASQCKFEPAHDVPTTVRVNFLLKSGQSRWHLLGVEFASPEGVVRPHFVNAPYPGGMGIAPAAFDSAHLIAVMGRHAVASLAFDVDEAGHPVRIRVQKATEPVWGEAAASLVRRWQFSPAKKDDKPVSTPCTVKLVWGEKELTQNSMRAAAAEFSSLR